MIAAIVQGGSTPGLLNYLVGPGRANEHESPHLVAGSQVIMSRFQEWDSLTPAQGYEIAKYVDQFMNELGVKPTGAARQYNHATGKVENVSATPNHVWHCSLSLSPEEGPLSETTWRKIADDFMSEMGFTGSDGKAPCRWVAVHHGSAKNGGDHIHIAANIVREDGTKWSPWQDQRRAQRTVNMLEHRHGLRVIEAREHARGARADSAADLRATQDRHAKALKDLLEDEARTQVATDRARLEVRVRAAAVGARSEADFVALLRDYGVRVRPRFEQGRADVVTGYSVALANHDPHARAQWYGGGRLARDLALPRLRMRWPDTPHGAQRAAVAWRQAWRGERVTGYDNARTTTRAWRAHAPSKVDWRVNAALIRAWHERVATINPCDGVALADATRDVSGLLASAGLASDNTAARHALMRASRGLGRHAQTHSRPAYHSPASHAASSAVRALTTARTSNELAVALLVAEIVELARSLSDLYAQAEQTGTALAILRDTQQAWQMLRSPTPQLAYSQTALREASTMTLPTAYTPGTGTPTTLAPERVATRALTEAADTSRTLTFDTPEQAERTQHAVAASVLADVIDEHPTIAAITVTRSPAVMPGGGVELRATDADGQALSDTSQQLTETMSRAVAPALFADRLAGRTYSREDFLEQINRPLIAAAVSTAHEVLTDERADRIRAMQQAAMPAASTEPAQQQPNPDVAHSPSAHEASVMAVATDTSNPWLTINQPPSADSPQASESFSNDGGEQGAGQDSEEPAQEPTAAQKQLARARSMLEIAMPTANTASKPAGSGSSPPQRPPRQTDTPHQGRSL